MFQLLSQPWIKYFCLQQWPENLLFLNLVAVHHWLLSIWLGQTSLVLRKPARQPPTHPAVSAHALELREAYNWAGIASATAGLYKRFA